MEKVLGREKKIIRVRERRGKEGGRVLIVQFKESEAGKIIESRGEIRYYWGVKVNEDLTMRERRNRWRGGEKGRREREREDG